MEARDLTLSGTSRYQLRDHSAHGDAGEVQLLQPKSIDNATGVMCHVIELIGDPKRAAQGRSASYARAGLFRTDRHRGCRMTRKPRCGHAQDSGHAVIWVAIPIINNDRIRRLAKFVVGDTNTVCFQILRHSPTHLPGGC